MAKEKEEAAKSQPLKVEEAVPAPAKAAEKEPETASSVKENLRKVPEPERAEPPKVLCPVFFLLRSDGFVFSEPASGS